MKISRFLNQFSHFIRKARLKSGFPIPPTKYVQQKLYYSGCNTWNNEKMVMTDTICISIFSILELQQVMQCRQASDFSAVPQGYSVVRFQIHT